MSNKRLSAAEWAEASFYHWKAKYGGITVSEAALLRDAR
jgi:hypothetical protein